MGSEMCIRDRAAACRTNDVMVYSYWPQDGKLVLEKVVPVEEGAFCLYLDMQAS